MARLKTAEEFLIQLEKDPWIFPGTTASVNLPKSFPPTHRYTESGIVKTNLTHLPAFNGQLQKVILPGFRLGVVGETPDKQLYFCNLAITDSLPGAEGRQNFQALVQGMVGGAFPGTTTGWEEVSMSTPDGGSLNWLRMRATGEQAFSMANEKGSGTLEIYLFQDDLYNVMVITRVPTGQELNTSFGKDLPLMMGTLKIDPLPVWTASPQAIASLTQGAKINTTEVKLPKDYVSVTTPLSTAPKGSGARIYEYSVSATPKNTEPLVDFFTGPPIGPIGCLDWQAENYVNNIRTTFQGDFRPKAIEHGKIGDRRFVRVQWTGTLQPSKIAISGMVYATAAGPDRIVIQTQCAANSNQILESINAIPYTITGP